MLLKELGRKAPLIASRSGLHREAASARLLRPSISVHESSCNLLIGEQGASSALHYSNTSAQGTFAGPKKQVLYRGRWMVPFRVLVRLKVFQLSGVAALAVPLGTFLSEGGVSIISLSIASALLVGCGASASALNYYSRRYVGELSLITPSPTAEPLLCFSVLDFWGHREDNKVPLANLVPPLRALPPEVTHQMAKQPLIPLKVDGERQFYVSLRYGIFVDKNSFIDILKGIHPLQNTDE